MTNREVIWNAAIEAAVKELRKNFIAPECVIKIIRRVKKKPHKK